MPGRNFWRRSLEAAILALRRRLLTRRAVRIHPRLASCVGRGTKDGSLRDGPFRACLRASKSFEARAKTGGCTAGEPRSGRPVLPALLRAFLALTAATQGGSPATKVVLTKSTKRTLLTKYVLEPDN